MHKLMTITTTLKILLLKIDLPFFFMMMGMLGAPIKCRINVVAFKLEHVLNFLESF